MTHGLTTHLSAGHSDVKGLDSYPPPAPQRNTFVPIGPMEINIKYLRFFCCKFPQPDVIKGLKLINIDHLVVIESDGEFACMENYAMAEKQRESLVVASKIKAYIKSKDMMTSAEAIDAISEEVYELLDDAIVRAQANRRSTVKAQDL